MVTSARPPATNKTTAPPIKVIGPGTSFTNSQTQSGAKINSGQKRSARTELVWQFN